MTATTYATIGANTQSTIFGIVAADSTLTTAGVKVTDGVPKDLISHRATFVTINSPYFSHDNQVLSNTWFNADISVPIVVHSRKESSAREVADSVVAALKNNQATTRAAKLHSFRVKSITTNQISVGETAQDTVYIHNITIGYRFQG